MTIDISRKSYDPTRHTVWTTTMQGRVSTDAPVNEDRSLRDRRLRSTMVDLGGRCGYPPLLPDSFLIGVAGGELTIAPGRYYVDGHQAENFGTGGPVFDEVLSELRGPDPVLFSDQPYGTEGVLPLEDGTHLVYLDVWQRDVTFLEDGSILDPAITTDSFARRQTVWQVRYFGPLEAGVDCATESDEIAGWTDHIAPSDARLTTRANPASALTDPCLLPPGAQYRGIDNRTYRVEIHDFQDDGTPLVKFSRVNGSVATTILALPQNDVIEVVQVAKDDFLRFNPGDWVEITDEQRLLAGESGTMARVLTVDDPSNTITLENPLPAGALVLDGGVDADQTRNPVLRRWDQANQVFDENGVMLADLDAAGSNGLIPAPTDGTFIALEDGVEAALTFAAGGEGHVNDNWTFIARFADSSVEELDAAPPQDYHHHYCRLAIASAAGGVFTAVIDDCRDPLDDDDDCCCTITVEPGDDIQAAIDEIPPDIGGCVCLTAGIHEIRNTIVVTTSNLRIVGESRGAIVQMNSVGPIMQVQGADAVDIDMIEFRHASTSQGAGLIEMIRSSSVNVERCRFASAGELASFGIALLTCAEIDIRDCEFARLATGILVGSQSEFVTIQDNSMALSSEEFEGLAGVHANGAIGPVTVTGNRISNVRSGVTINDDALGLSRQSGADRSLVADNVIELLVIPQDDETIVMHGVDIAADECTVRGNHIRFAGSGRAGIRATGYGHTITENQIEADLNADDDGLTTGIAIGVTEDDVAHRTENVLVAQNHVREVSLAILVADAADVTVSENELTPFANRDLAAISLIDTVAAMVRDNSIPLSRFGISSQRGRNTRIEGNRIGPTGIGISFNAEFGSSVKDNTVGQSVLAGMFFLQCLGRLVVSGNAVSNSGAQSPFAFGLGALFHLGEWHVTGNEVFDTGTPVDGTPPVGVAAGIFGFLILEAFVSENYVSYGRLENRPDGQEDRALFLHGMFEFSFEFSDNVGSLGFPCQISNNTFRGKGQSALVELRQTPLIDNFILRFERVIFSHNYCEHWGPMDQGGASVLIDGRAGVVSGNQVKTFGLAPSMNLQNMPGTVMGNITTNAIANGPNFPNPESSFNQLI